jgi:hypothetical protein
MGDRAVNQRNIEVSGWIRRLRSIIEAEMRLMRAPQSLIAVSQRSKSEPQN